MSSLILRACVLLMTLMLAGGVYAGPVLPAQTSDQAAVMVKVSPQNPESAVWEFEVTVH